MYKNDLFDLLFGLLHSFCRSSRAERDEKEWERKALTYGKTMEAKARMRSLTCTALFRKMLQGGKTEKQPYRNRSPLGPL